MKILRWFAIAVLTLTAAMVSGFASAASAGGTVLVLGDSLSAGYGLAAGQGWVDLLSAKVARESPGFKVVNASLSGDTTHGGRARLMPLIARHRPTVLVVELGANDALRGGELELTRKNLESIVRAGRDAGARTVVIGMRIPPNYGPDYTRRFEALFADVARATQSAYVPFLLEGVAERREMFQPDGLHPVAAAQPRILDNVWPALRPLLASKGR